VSERPSVSERPFPLGSGLPEAVRTALLGADGAVAREQLSSDVVGWLTTVAADGRPQTSVISFLWDGDGILFAPTRPRSATSPPTGPSRSTSTATPTATTS
jgi:hypothetical protein